jgi:hypothetical protein
MLAPRALGAAVASIHRDAEKSSSRKPAYVFLEAGASEVLPKSITFVETLAAVRRLGGKG